MVGWVSRSAYTFIPREYRRQHALLDRIISHVSRRTNLFFFLFLYSTCNRWYPVCRTEDPGQRTERKRRNSIFCHAIFAPAPVARGVQSLRFASENTFVVLIVFLAINLWTINFNDDYARQGERERIVVRSTVERKRERE